MASNVRLLHVSREASDLMTNVVVGKRENGGFLDELSWSKPS